MVAGKKGVWVGGRWIVCIRIHAPRPSSLPHLAPRDRIDLCIGAKARFRCPVMAPRGLDPWPPRKGAVCIGGDARARGTGDDASHGDGPDESTPAGHPVVVRRVPIDRQAATPLNE